LRVCPHLHSSAIVGFCAIPVPCRTQAWKGWTTSRVRWVSPRREGWFLSDEVARNEGENRSGDRRTSKEM